MAPSLNFSLTEKAAAKIVEFAKGRPETTERTGLRVGIKGGGCSGMSYVFEICDAPREKDRSEAIKAIEYLQGAARRRLGDPDPVDQCWMQTVRRKRALRNNAGFTRQTHPARHGQRQLERRGERGRGQPGFRKDFSVERGFQFAGEKRPACGRD